MNTSNWLQRLKNVLPLAAVFCSFMFALTPSGLRAEQSPFFADDLKPGERWRSGDHPGGSQALGHDFSVRRHLGDGKWSALHPMTDGTKNHHRLAWGKPVYAMEDGVILRSWRNAPDNLKPGVKHESVGDGIPGGGNHILVQSDSGAVTLYAHFQKGTLDSKWCPVDDAFVPSGSKGHVFPEDKRPKIKKGQFIGLVGNSGSSSGPHLHVHKLNKLNGSPLAIPMERGLISEIKDGKADINSWTALKGKAIPQKSVLFWPPRRLHAEYSRAKFPEADFGRMFQHLADSGYQLTWLDGYSVGGKVYFNHIWHKANGSWRAYYGLTQSDIQTKLDQSKPAGYEPVYLDSYTRSGQVRYNTILRKNVPGAWLLRTNRTANQHQEIFDQAKKDGLKPVSISVVSIGGQRRYSALYRSSSIGSWSADSSISEGDYQSIFESNRSAGRLPIYLNAYMDGGKPYVSAIFASKPSGAFKARHGLSASSLQSEFDAAMKLGYLSSIVTSFDGASSQHRYFAVWRK